MKAIKTASPIRRHRKRTVKIPLTKGKFAIIDKADEELVKKSKWCLAGAGRIPSYAAARRKGRKILLHRMLLPTLPGFDIDHIDGNPLNNSRSNLRVCTRAQNIANSPGRYRKKSRFKNVFRQGKKWRVTLRKNSRYFHFGYFSSDILAACVSDDAAVMFWGEFAWENFKKKIPRNFLRRFFIQSGGRIMCVTFYKRSAIVNGQGRNSRALRTMKCRIGVRRDIKGEGLSFRPEDRGLISVYDMEKQCYRFVPTEGVLCLTYKGERYRVTPDPKPYNAA